MTHCETTLLSCRYSRHAAVVFFYPMCRVWCFMFRNRLRQLRVCLSGLLSFLMLYLSCTGWRKKTGPSYLVANIPKIPWPNCVEIGELLQYYMLNTVINFLFKNSIALWCHLAKTQLLCDAQIYLYTVNKRQQHFNTENKFKKVWRHQNRL